MIAKLSRWGNSLGLRIPKQVAEDAKIGDGSEVEVSVEKGRIVVTPVAPTKFALADLLAQITDDNRHDEVDFGGPIGKEAW